MEVENTKLTESLYNSKDLNSKRNFFKKPCKFQTYVLQINMNDKEKAKKLIKDIVLFFFLLFFLIIFFLFTYFHSYLSHFYFIFISSI